MADTTTYEQDVRLRLDRYRKDTVGSAESALLFELLGCRYLQRGKNNGSSPWVILEGAQPDERHEDIVANAFVTLMRTLAVRGDGFSVLDGLTRRNRWRSCLGTLEDGHCSRVF